MVWLGQRSTISDESVKLFGREAMLSVQEKRRPDYDLERLNQKFGLSQKPKLSHVISIPATDYNYNNYQNSSKDMNQPLLTKNCLCIII